MDISIATAKEIRESIGATHLVIFAIDKDHREHVATHGETESDAREAAIAGNKLKKALGWPDEHCHAKPLNRCCDNCTYWKADYGIHCFNGWSGDGSTGWCRLNPTHVKVERDNKCQFFSPK
jgi:hypothetical protein